MPVSTVRFEDWSRTANNAVWRNLAATFSVHQPGVAPWLVRVEFYGSFAEDLKPRFQTGAAADFELRLASAVLRLVLLRIEDALNTGVLELDSAQTMSTDLLANGLPVTLHGDSSFAEQLAPFLIGKTCSYQVHEERDLYCGCAADDDETAVGRIGLRMVAPTSQALCRGCNLPDTDYICSHLHHPTVTAGVTFGGHERVIAGALCDLGRSEIRDPSGCKADGHRCWERLVEIESPRPPAVVSALTLPDALDFLNLAWERAFGSPLLRLRSVDTAASLALPCATRVEFNARLSAFWDTISLWSIQDDLLNPEDRNIPADQTLTRLRAVLAARLSLQEDVEVDDALRVLRAVGRARVGGQHSGAAPKLIEAFATLGSTYPPERAAWDTTWDTFRATIAGALDTLRQRILTLPPA